ncbi:hypothetical protein MANES_02G205251v8 [Manihot esculenta]|uniref:Uncharacterized protein n=1 Tax=Manihot esculenta TaxID=3983 RepID=A0ACB7I772_MANES|nr:hypothetical protein MANES_02G205251v8 [Manihot esculenta]
MATRTTTVTKMRTTKTTKTMMRGARTTKTTRFRSYNPPEGHRFSRRMTTRTTMVKAETTMTMVKAETTMTMVKAETTMMMVKAETTMTMVKAETTMTMTMTRMKTVKKSHLGCEFASLRVFICDFWVGVAMVFNIIFIKLFC